MTCEEARISMHFHLDGDDHPHVRLAREHTATCTHCERYVSDLLELEQSLRGLPRYAAPPGLKEKVLLAVTGMPQKQPRTRMRLS